MNRFAWAFPYGVSLLLSLLFLGVVGFQIPILRHDWAWFPFGAGTTQVLLEGSGGWNSFSGIGAPAPYPSQYLATLVIVLLRTIVGDRAAFISFVTLLAGVITLGASAIARALDTGRIAAIGAMLFALFNPWVYNKLVAGHLFMLLAYGASMWLLAALLSPRRAVAAATFWSILIVQQLQFLIISQVLVACWCIKWQRWLPLITLVVVSLPVAVGILGNWHYLAATPYTLTWERGQSVRPLEAVLLSGYFADYSRVFAGAGESALTVILGLAVFGGVAACNRATRAVSWILAATALLLCVAMGTYGPLSVPFRWALEHFAPTGIYRELYDLLGYVAIGYLALALIATRQARHSGWLLFMAGIVLATVWVEAPPARFWLAAPAVPRVAIAQQPNTRFALMPPFQPMSFNGRGSGMDPDNYPRPQDVSPINEYLASYPSSSALASYALNGDTSGLAGLSVSYVYFRPWLRSDRFSLAQISALRPTVPGRRGIGAPPIVHATDGPLPELSLIKGLRIGTLTNKPGSGALFFGDLAGHKRLIKRLGLSNVEAPSVVKSDNRFVHADEGWVDARLAFAERPALGQAFGGALTTDTNAELAVRGGSEALVWVDGLLVSSHRKIYRGHGGYAWIPIPRGAARVRCLGTCVVALQGRPPPGVPLNPAPMPAQGVQFRSPVPWLATADLQPNNAALVRYNVAFDRHWTAFLGGVPLEHVRIDAIVNGWLLPKHDRGGRLIIVQELAALQVAVEVAAILWVGAIGLVAAARLFRSHGRSDAR